MGRRVFNAENAEDAENDRNWGTANRKRHGGSPQRRRGRRGRQELGNGETARQFTAETQRPQRTAGIGERRTANGTAVHRRDAEDAENDRNWGTANRKRHGSSPQRRGGRKRWGEQQCGVRNAECGVRSEPVFVPARRDYAVAGGNGGRRARGERRPEEVPGIRCAHPRALTARGGRGN